MNADASSGHILYLPLSFPLPICSSSLAALHYSKIATFSNTVIHKYLLHTTVLYSTRCVNCNSNNELLNPTKTIHKLFATCVLRTLEKNPAKKLRDLNLFAVFFIFILFIMDES